MRWAVRIAAGLGVALATDPLSAACQISKMIEIPVTMTGRRPIVTAQIDGRDARFILDSGAFFSTISQAAALEFGLPIREVAPNVRLKGIGGDTSLRSATVKLFTLAGKPLPNVQFVVGGSDTGVTGLLGQNILGIGDVEYDLPHGVVRLMKTQGCRGANLAYWAGGKPATMVPIEPLTAHQRHTIGTVTVNGRKLRALFDSGAETTLLTQAAARRAGVTRDTAGVEPHGYSVGLGQSRVRVWRAQFDRIDIGGEAIAKPHLLFADQDLVEGDMLLGFDFFLTHRIYIDNQDHRAWITYEGGPLFGLDPKGAVDDHGAALNLVDTAGDPTDAAGFGRRGAVRASAGKIDLALADFDRAVALAPQDAHLVYQRAMLRIANRQPLLAATDLDTAIRLAPQDGEARMARARLRLAARDRAGALEDARAADAAYAPSADRRLGVALLYSALDAWDAAIPDYDLWLDSHPEDHARPTALNGRCWARAMLGRDLGKAESDCNAALRLRPGDPAMLDSRALVRFRLGQYEKAVADYDAALSRQPRNALALYVRALAERRLGQTAKADADRAAALAINRAVADRAALLRLDASAPGQGGT